MRTSFSSLLVLTLTLLGCGGDDAPATPDAGTVILDSGTDAPPPPVDSGTDAPPPPVDSGTDAGMCVPVAMDGPRRGTMCLPMGAGGIAPCPDGYVCQAETGIITNYTCQIPCTRDCECPEGLECATITDKAGPRMQCESPPA
jgi:hypothetical protein